MGLSMTRIENRESCLQSALMDQKDIDVLQTSLFYLADLFRAVLDLRTGKNGKSVVLTRTNILEDILEPIKKILSYRGEPFEFQVTVDHMLLKESILVDHMLLQQSVLSLASNSRKFTKQGFIRLEAKKVKSNDDDVDSIMQIVVEDFGPGIPTICTFESRRRWKPSHGPLAMQIQLGTDERQGLAR
jgi:signal transduction histidine kinase